MSAWGLALLALLAGGLQAASIAWPLSWGLPGLLAPGEPADWLQVLSLALLAHLLASARHARAAAGLGWAFATAWLTGTFWWLFISMNTYGGLNAPLSALGVLALALALGLYYAIAAGLWWRLSAGTWRPTAVLAFAGLWTLAELARGRLFTGFPWGAGGYAHADGWLAAWAPWVGVYGIGFIAAAIAAVLAAGVAALRSPRNPQQPGRGPGPGMSRRAASVASGVALATACGTLWLPEVSTRSTGSVDLALLQGNIPQNQKFEPGSGVPQALQWYAEQLSRPWPDALVIAPETALPLLPDALPPGYWEALRQRFAGPAGPAGSVGPAGPADGASGGTSATAPGGRAAGSAALIGVPLGDYRAGYTNSAVGWAPGQPDYRYDKHHLVPFGEFVPPLFRWFTDLMRIPLGNFASGGPGQASFEWRGQRFAPNVCYEDLFGEELAARFVDASRAPTVFVNLGNIAWFGNTVAIDQHLHISRMRSLEFARPMVRATNTGATAVIDHRGEVVVLMQRHLRGVLRATVEGRDGATPYARWVAAFGLWPLLLVSLLVSLLACGPALASRWRTGGQAPRP